MKSKECITPTFISSQQSNWAATKNDSGRGYRIPARPSLDDYDGYEEETDQFPNKGRGY